MTVYAVYGQDPPRASVHEIPDADLLRRAVRTLCHHSENGRTFRPRWAVVADAFALGSTFAAQLCRRFDLDPSAMVNR